MAEFNGTFTPYYDLAKPSGTDKVDISVLNDNYDKIDAALWDLYSRLGPTPPQPAVTEFTIDTTDGSLHYSSYYAYGGIDYSINLVEGDVWSTELIADGETQQGPDLTVVKLSEVSPDAGALADNLCLDHESMGTIIDKAETKFNEQDMYAPIYNANKTTWALTCVEDGQIIPYVVKYTRKSEN